MLSIIVNDRWGFDCRDQATAVLKEEIAELRRGLSLETVDINYVKSVLVSGTYLALTHHWHLHT